MSFFSHVANAQASVCICTFGSKCVVNRLSKCVTTILLAGSQAMNPMELLRNLMVSQSISYEFLGIPTKFEEFLGSF